MPDWRDASPNYITYASSPHKTEAPHAYLSLDAVVNFHYEADEFQRSINETPPRSRYDRRRRVRRADAEVESSGSSSSSSSGEDERGEGWEPPREAGAGAGARAGAEEPVRETNEISEYRENNSMGVAGDDDVAGGREINVDDEASSRYERSINETIFEAMDEAVDGMDFADEDAVARGKREIGKRKGKGPCAGGDADMQAPVKGSLKDLLVEVEGENSEKVNRFERD